MMTGADNLRDTRPGQNGSHERGSPPGRERGAPGERAPRSTALSSTTSDEVSVDDTSDIVGTEIVATTEINSWVDKIRPHLAKAVESIVAVGTILIEAKAELPHGEFGGLCNQIGFTTRTAQRFMAIARHPALSNPTHASHLPPAWSTLSDLAALETTEVETAIDSGRISPRLNRDGAKILVAEVVCRRLNPDFMAALEQLEPMAPKVLGPRWANRKDKFGVDLSRFDGLSTRQLNPDVIASLSALERAEWIARCKASEQGLRRFRRELEQLGELQ